MRSLLLALSLVVLAACKGKEQPPAQETTPPAADTTPAAADTATRAQSDTARPDTAAKR